MDLLGWIFLLWAVVGTFHIAAFWYMFGVRRGTGEAVYGPAGWPRDGDGEKGEKGEMDSEGVKKRRDRGGVDASVR